MQRNDYFFLHLYELLQRIGFDELATDDVVTLFSPYDSSDLHLTSRQAGGQRLGQVRESNVLSPGVFSPDPHEMLISGLYSQSVLQKRLKIIPGERRVASSSPAEHIQTAMALLTRNNRKNNERTVVILECLTPERLEAPQLMECLRGWLHHLHLECAWWTKQLLSRWSSWWEQEKRKEASPNVPLEIRSGVCFWEKGCKQSARCHHVAMSDDLPHTLVDKSTGHFSFTYNFP